MGWNSSSQMYIKEASVFFYSYSKHICTPIPGSQFRRLDPLDYIFYSSPMSAFLQQCCVTTIKLGVDRLFSHTPITGPEQAPVPAGRHSDT